MAKDDMIVISRKALLDAWYEAQDAIIAETEARKELEHLHEICDKKKRILFDMIDKAEDYVLEETGEEGDS
jgi:hypothetical protein